MNTTRKHDMTQSVEVPAVSLTGDSTTDYENLPAPSIGGECHYLHLADEDIHFVYLTSMGRKSVDAWVDKSIAIREETDPADPLLVACDMSDLDFGFTPYALKRGGDMMKVKNQEVKTFIACIIRPGIVGSMIKNFIDLGNGRNNTYYRVCYERQSAFDWLHEQEQRFRSEQA